MNGHSTVLIQKSYSQDALHGTSPSVWVPYASLDQLLVLLKDVQPDSELAQVRFLSPL